MSRATAYIALGSNLGDREAALRWGLRRLNENGRIEVVAVSAFIETAAVGLAGQDRYLNAAAALETSLSPRELLDAMLAVERAHGRRRDPAVRWGPRTLDLDLLMYGEAIIDEPELTVPHPRMHERSFVLVPLAEIAPGVAHPRLGRTIEWLRDQTLQTGSRPE